MLNKCESDPPIGIIKRNPGRYSDDMSGQKVGRLLFLERAQNDERGFAMWKCRCDCGKYKIVRGASIKSGHVQSCGCFHRERTIACSRGRPYEWILAQIRTKKEKMHSSSTLTY